MEFVGKIVRKEFKGFGVFEGVIESYDSSTGFFKVLYEDGDSEDVDFSEVSRLINQSVVVDVIDKKIARKNPRKRRRFDSGKSSDVNDVDCDDNRNRSRNCSRNCSGNNDEIDDDCVVVCNNIDIDVNVDVNVCVNGNVNGDDDGDGIDLNRELNFEEGVENGEIKGCIDLNLSVVDDGSDEGGVRVEERGNEQGFDLNLGVNEESVNGEMEMEMETGSVIVMDSSECVGLSEGVKIGDGSFVDSRVCEDRVEENGSGGVGLNLCEEGNNSGRRKRKKVDKNLNSPTETVLRRSARRAKAVALQESNVSREKVEEEVNDLPVSGVIDEPEEKPIPEEVVDTFVEPQAPPANLVFPPSSANIDLEGIPVLDIFSVYSCLRSFSTLLYLSPFELEDFVAALKNRVSNQLIDFIHVSILQTLRKHLELLATEGCESSSTCLRNLNWDLLDLITWPIFMVEYLLIRGSWLKPGFTFDSLKLFVGEYYKQPVEVKIELLRCLCDDVLEVEAIRSELSKRTSIAEASMEKRRISVDAHGDSLSEDVKEEVDDGNSDECRLCKMDGNLICCDGCPAAYHSKCVGIVNSLLPEGDWYCPECLISRKNSYNRSRKFFRGAELLGIDPEGRSFFSCFDYLLVSDSFDAEGFCSYYHKDDLGAVIQLLKSSAVYGAILSAISKHWDFMTNLCQLKDSAKLCMEMENLLTSSEGSGEVLQENRLVQKSRKPVSKKRKQKGSSASKGKISSNAKEEDILLSQPGDSYMNSYSFARTAASVVEELLKKPSGKVHIEAPKTEEEIITIQSKFILKKEAKSCWPTIQNMNGERHKEKCGWCYCCRFPVEGRGCLFIVKNTSSISVTLKADIDGVVSKRNKKGHLVDVMSYILCMEERLRGFLTGPWLKPQYSEIWRQNVLKASDVLSLKLPLLTLESNLRSLALWADWWKHIDLATTMGSASHFVASSRGTSKNGISKKKVRYADPETKSSAARSGLLLFWWRGGKTSRNLFNWKVVPRSSALKAARRAGCMKIPDVQYPDASESARRTKCVAWRAAVETSKSLEQLALQVRELDLFIRWDDIENTHHHSLLDKESIKSIRLFKKVIVRRKSLEGTVARYLLDFGKRRSVPDVVLKNGKKLEDSSCEKKKYWLDEVHVPLHLLKSFEDRRITRKAGKKPSKKLRTVGKVVKKPLREKGFDYLFSRAERADCYQCGHCNKNVPISEAVICQLCNGYFHKRHVMKLSEGVTSECTFTCHRCRAGKNVKKRNLRKRKFGELREAKSLKVDSEGVSAKLRGRPKKKGKLLANHRQVLSQNAKKVQKHEKTKRTNSAYTGITLRRSARTAKCIAPHPNKVTGGKKKKKRKPRKEAQRLSKRPKNVASKETSKGILWQKKRTVNNHSFWINGLLLSGKPNDERVVQFKKTKLLVPSEFSTDIDDQPKCSLCSQQRSVPGLIFVACEICDDWFHGEAFGLNKENIENLAGFKCHICLEKSSPVCPFGDISRDDNIRLSEATSESHDAQGLPVVSIRKETDCVEVRYDDSSDPHEVHTAQKSDGNLDEDETLELDTNLRIEDGSRTCKILCCNEGSTGEAEDAQGLPDVLAVLKEAYSDEDSSGLLGLHKADNCDRKPDQVEIPKDAESKLANGLLSCKERPVLYSELRVENSSPPSQDPQCDEGSTGEALDAQELPEIIAVAKDTICVPEYQGNEYSSGMSAQIRGGNPDHDETPKQDFELRVENGSLTGKELQCDEASLLHSYTVQNCVRNSGQDKSTVLDIELRVEQGSSANEEVLTLSVGQDVDMDTKSMKESDEKNLEGNLMN